MSAMENAKKLSREEVLEKISSLKMREYGVYNETIQMKFQAAIEESQEASAELMVVAALNNSDTAGVLLEVLQENPDKILMGMNIAAYALDAQRMLLHIPAQAKDLMEKLEPMAKQYGVELVNGLADRRAYKGCLLIHIITMAELAEAFADTYTESVYISVNGAKVQRFDPDKTVAEIADTTDAKALLLGYRLHSPQDAGLSLKDAQITNGVLRVLTAKNCIIWETEKRLLASRKQSCGKCVFCREGLIQLEGMHKDITEGKGRQEYPELTVEIGTIMGDSTSCSMGQKAAEMAQSAIELFAKEYEAHIKKKNCPANVCSSFQTIYVDPQMCTGCEECVDICPANCIEGKAGYIHMIDSFDCTKCGKCISACDNEAIIQTTGKVPKLPNRLTKAGKFKRH